MTVDVGSRTLNPLELTGRATTHVEAQPDLGCVLHRQAAGAFRALRAAAADAGLDLAALSSFRDYERQRTIWNGKFLGLRPVLDRRGQALDATALDPRARIEHILLWSALPGASRHHWGTDLDVFDARAMERSTVRLVPAEYAPEGPFAPLVRWLDAHAAHFGFFRPYARDRGGVLPEPWHLSYAPVAAPALAALTPAVLAAALAAEPIEGGALVNAHLAALHARYVSAVEDPGAALAPRAQGLPA